MIVSLFHRNMHTIGWLRLVGSLKLLASFAEYRLFYRALLQKRPVILRSVLIVATPYHKWAHNVHTICTRLYDGSRLTRTCLFFNLKLVDDGLSFSQRVFV